jgi:hypothetical protein
LAKNPISIKAFLGLNEQGNTQLKLGEAEIMTNWRLVDEYKPRVIEGYSELFESIASNKSIKGMWYGEVNNAYHFLFACNGHVYDLDLSDNTYDDLGTLTDAYTNFFFFDSKVYIQNGNKYYSWAGTGSIAEVAGYVPLVAVNTPPAGGGTNYEGINVLIGSKRQWFSGDATAVDYFIAEQNVNSIDYVKNLVTGTNYTVTTDYTVDLTAGKVHFTSAPADLENNVEIKWTKGTGNRSAIEGCKAAVIYNGANDTRVFMWGNSANQNRRYHSGLADGIPSAEYFPATNYYDIGTNQDAITDIVKQHDRQIIYTDGGKAFYSYYDSITFDDGTVSVSFPVHPLNDAIGNVAFGQAQLILNNPFTIYTGVYQWQSTYVRDERNALYMSKRVQPSLDEVDLSTAITYDYEKKHEYWLAIGSTVWVYNYRLDAWYKFAFSDTPTCFISINGIMYFGTNNGQIMKFDDGSNPFPVRDFNGEPIRAEMYMGFTDAGYGNRVKHLEESHISLKAELHAAVDVYWETNKKNPKDLPKPIGYNNLDFDDIDFDDWSFEGNYNPQPFRVKTKAKDWVYFRHIFILESDFYTAQIIEVNIEPTIGGYSK